MRAVRTCCLATFYLATYCLAVSPSPTLAQDPAPAAPTDDDTAASVLDGVFGEEQAARGEATFRRICAACHSSREFSGSAFTFAWTGRSVGDLYENLKTTMPYDRPGSLRAAEYLDVIAYILKRNGYPAGETELAGTVEELERIRIRQPEDRSAGSSER